MYSEAIFRQRNPEVVPHNSKKHAAVVTSVQYHLPINHRLRSAIPDCEKILG